MVPVRVVAKFLVGLAPAEAMTAERLHGLLYYCQGWALALLGRPLFGEAIGAAETGPVVEGLEGADTSGNAVSLSDTEAALCRMVATEYLKHPPAELLRMARSEPAWIEASRGGGVGGSPELSHATMATYFTETARRLARRPGVPFLDPVAEWRAEDEWESAGRPTVPLAEVRADLLHGTGR